jgi:hypothetical protein
MVVDKFSAWGFDYPPAVGSGIVGCALANSDTLGHVERSAINLIVRRMLGTNSRARTERGGSRQ